MVGLNSDFPVFERRSLNLDPKTISEALLEKGVCYISGFEKNLEGIQREYNLLNLTHDGVERNVRVLRPKSLKEKNSMIYRTICSPEFKWLKQHVLGRFFKDNIEIFAQLTRENPAPNSGLLHFDKRYTFKIWYYVNDIDICNGAMRVVPFDSSKASLPTELRREYGTKALFGSGETMHKPDITVLPKLESEARYVTGPAGTLFVHLTEAWHGASPVFEGKERMILRAHSRPFSDYFV
jgi:hypothetical protein